MCANGKLSFLIEIISLHDTILEYYDNYYWYLWNFT